MTDTQKKPRGPGMVAGILRAMAEGYTELHTWDDLDAEVCRQAADHLAAIVSKPADTKQAQSEALWQAFEAELAKLPKPMQQTIRESAKRNESNSWTFFKAGAALVANPPQPEGRDTPQAEPVAWRVYIPSQQRQDYYGDINDSQLVDDMTNCPDAQLTPLYAGPQAELKALTQAEIERGWETEDVAPSDAPESLFDAGARFAERHHGIGQPAAQGGDHAA